MERAAHSPRLHGPDHLPTIAVIEPTIAKAVESALRARAFLHDDPGAYRAGVHDAIAELAVPPSHRLDDDEAADS